MEEEMGSRDEEESIRKPRFSRESIKPGRKTLRRDGYNSGEKKKKDEPPEISMT